MEPLVIGFPVIEVDKWTLDAKGRLIILRMAVVKPEHLNGRPPTHCKVMGRLENGQILEWVTIPIQVYQDAIRKPVFFVECADVRGPTVAIQGPSVIT